MNPETIKLTDPRLQAASDFVCHTGRHVFLTGKAGTGKTTFLQNLKHLTAKRMVVVAPTGVAAINAGGVTIHSFFQLPYGPQLPESLMRRVKGEAGGIKKFSREKVRIIKCLDLLIIDEVSMVRADLLDGIDEVLRRFRDPRKVFGGVQVLMVGDLHQLSPVVKDDEWQIMKDFYDTVYFFSSKAYQAAQAVTIELTHIFRQSDREFIGILNAVRNNTAGPEVLRKLNARYRPGFVPEEKDAYITLTTHNASASEINQAQMKRLAAPSFFFEALVSGDFPSHAFPTDERLELKVGAQVMFVRNDPGRDKRYFNGKIGTITALEGEEIEVTCPGEVHPVRVGRSIWNNLKYSMNEETREVTEETTGSFEQIPLKPAWAITIHKSQGLTFERAIIDARAAFAYGQVYVALSRCRTLEGLVLSTPLSAHGIMTDSKVLQFNDAIDPGICEQENILKARRDYERSLILELFDFGLLRYRSEQWLRLNEKHGHSVLMTGSLRAAEWHERLNSGVIQFAARFMAEIRAADETLRGEPLNQELMKRIPRAAEYFISVLEPLYQDVRNKISFECDQSALREELTDAYEKLQKDLFVKTELLRTAQNVFSVNEYLRVRRDAELDFKPVKTGGRERTAESRIKVPHEQLFRTLLQWRDDLAGQNDLPQYYVIPAKTIIKLCEYLPLSQTDLLSVPGIGKKKVAQFGDELLGIITAYCLASGVTPDQKPVSQKKRKRKKTPKGDEQD